jgi:hypothetical protein
MDFTYPTSSFFAQKNELTSYKNVLTQPDFSNWNPLWILSIIHFSIIKNGFWFLTFWIGPLLGVSGYITINVKLMGDLIDIKLGFVTKGFTQLKRIDYNETFSRMVKIISLWILFALATIHDYHVDQLDVQTAFLHGHLDEEIWNNPLITCLYQMKIKFVSFWQLFMDWSRVQDFGMQDLMFIYLN